MAHTVMFRRKSEKNKRIFAENHRYFSSHVSLLLLVKKAFLDFILCQEKGTKEKEENDCRGGHHIVQIRFYEGHQAFRARPKSKHYR